MRMQRLMLFFAVSAAPSLMTAQGRMKHSGTSRTFMHFPRVTCDSALRRFRMSATQISTLDSSCGTAAMTSVPCSTI